MHSISVATLFSLSLYNTHLVCMKPRGCCRYVEDMGVQCNRCKFLPVNSSYLGPVAPTSLNLELLKSGFKNHTTGPKWFLNPDLSSS